MASLDHGEGRQEHAAMDLVGEVIEDTRPFTAGQAGDAMLHGKLASMHHKPFNSKNYKKKPVLRKHF